MSSKGSQSQLIPADQSTESVEELHNVRICNTFKTILDGIACECVCACACACVRACVYNAYVYYSILTFF